MAGVYLREERRNGPGIGARPRPRRVFDLDRAGDSEARTAVTIAVGEEDFTRRRAWGVGTAARVGSNRNPGARGALCGPVQQPVCGCQRLRTP